MKRALTLILAGIFLATTAPLGFTQGLDLRVTQGDLQKMSPQLIDDPGLIAPEIDTKKRNDFLAISIWLFLLFYAYGQTDGPDELPPGPPPCR